MSIEVSALNFIKEVQQAYFEDGDIVKVLSMLDDDITYIGTGRYDVFRGIEAVERMMYEKGEWGFPGSFDLISSCYEAVRTPDDRLCLVYGSVEIREKDAQYMVASTRMRVSAVCKIEDNVMKLVHIHLSLPGDYRADDEYLPRALTDQSNAALRRLVDDKSAELECLMDNIPGGVQKCLNDDYFTILRINEGLLSMLGYTRQEVKALFEDRYIYLVHPDDRQRVKSEIESNLSGGDGRTAEAEYRIVGKDGEPIWVLDKRHLVRSDDGHSFFYCIVVDITNEVMAKEELRLSLERHKIIMNQANDIIFEWDIVNDKLIFSSNWKKKFGYDPVTGDVENMASEKSNIHPEDRTVLKTKIDAVTKGNPFAEVEVRIRRHDDQYIWCRIRATTQYDDYGKAVKAVGVIVDIDSDKRHSEELEKMAERDALTGIYNKGAVQSIIEHYLMSCLKDELEALVIIDVDNFKTFNDTLGHLFGDAVLTDVSNRIYRIFCATGVVGRVGGDEFVVFIKNVPDNKFVAEKVEQIFKAFDDMFVGYEMDFSISCSMGFAMSPSDGRTFKELFRNADSALYRAKTMGKNKYVFYKDDKLANGDEILGQPDDIGSAVNEKIDSNDQIRVLNNRLVEYVFKILYESLDIETAVQLILEIVGRQFDVSRAYIFENSEDDTYCSNTFEWCNEGIAPEIHNLQKISYDYLVNYQDNFDEDGIFYCRDISSLNEAQYAVLEPQGIKSMLQCAIKDNGKFKGYVGFDDCKVKRFWTKGQINALSFISEILSTFLLKKRAQDRVAQSMEALQAILDAQNSWIYVIDPDTYELLYINRKTMSLVPNASVGMRCYQAYFELDSPCQVCPARKAIKGDGRCTIEIYNPVLKVWSSADASIITWKERKACMLSCYDISRYKS